MRPLRPAASQTQKSRRKKQFLFFFLSKRGRDLAKRKNGLGPEFPIIVSPGTQCLTKISLPQSSSLVRNKASKLPFNPRERRREGEIWGKRTKVDNPFLSVSFFFAKDLPKFHGYKGGGWGGEKRDLLGDVFTLGLEEEEEGRETPCNGFVFFLFLLLLWKIKAGG